MAKNKLLVLKKKAEDYVMTYEELPDLAKYTFSGTYHIIIEPLKDWAGINYRFQTVDDVEYTIKFEIDFMTTTASNKFRVISTDSGMPGVLNECLNITGSGVYTFKHKMKHDGWIKFFYEEVNGADPNVSLEHTFAIKNLEIYVEDPALDFSVCNSTTKPFILTNLQVNHDEIASDLLGKGLYEYSTADYIAATNKLEAIKTLFDKINHFNFLDPFGTELAALNLPY